MLAETTTLPDHSADDATCQKNNADDRNNGFRNPKPLTAVILATIISLGGLFDADRLATCRRLLIGSRTFLACLWGIGYGVSGRCRDNDGHKQCRKQGEQLHYAYDSIFKMLGEGGISLHVVSLLRSRRKENACGAFLSLLAAPNLDFYEIGF